MYYLKKKNEESALVRKLDKVFSKYIRLRDAMSGGLFRCISCGKVKAIGQADAGHYFSRTKMSTRFDEDNVHAECKACNRFGADHLIGYRENLIKKIGVQRYKMLDIKAHSDSSLDKFQMQLLVDYYRKKITELETIKGIKL